MVIIKAIPFQSNPSICHAMPFLRY